MKTNKYKFDGQIFTSLFHLKKYADSMGYGGENFLASLNLTEMEIGIPCRYNKEYLLSLVTEETKIEIINL